MKALIVLGLVATAGCEDATGVEIIVHVGTTHSEYVELFVGEDVCKDETGARCAPAWTTKHDLPVVTEQAFTHRRARPFRTKVKDGVASFILKPEDGHEGKTVLVVGIVGFDGSGAFEQENVTGAYVIEKTFEATGPTQFDVVLDDELLVDVWSQTVVSGDREPERCAVFDDQTEAIVIVPDDDHDCDDRVPETACFAQDFHNANAGTTYCIDDPVGDKCIFGSQSCDATSGALGSCIGEVYPPNDTNGGGIACLPSPACADAVMPTCATDPDGCRGRVLADLPATDECTIHYGFSAAGSGGGYVLCPGTANVMIPLPTTVGSPTCQRAQVAESTGGKLTWGSGVDLFPNSTFTARVDVGLALAGNACLLQVKTSGSWPQDPATPPLKRLVVRLDLSNPYSLWVPIDLDAKGSSGGTMMCDGMVTTCGPLSMGDLSLLACSKAL